VQLKMGFWAKFIRRSWQVQIIAWFYVSVAILIAMLFVIDQRSWESNLSFEVGDNPAFILNYVSLCISMVTLIIAPFFFLVCGYCWTIRIPNLDDHLTTHLALFDYLISHQWHCTFRFYKRADKGKWFNGITRGKCGHEHTIRSVGRLAFWHTSLVHQNNVV